jgi:hypothetical protein
LEDILSAVIKYRKPDGSAGELAAGVGDTAKGVIVHECIEGGNRYRRLVGVLGIHYLCRWQNGGGGDGKGLCVERRKRVMAKRKNPEERYRENIRKQQKILEEYAAHEIEWAGDLLLWYRIKKREMPDDEYRAVAFFKNREYLNKPGSLTLAYEMYLRCIRELPEYTRETAFDLLAFRFRMYAEVLKVGGV